jgi:hypothetical protein
MPKFTAAKIASEPTAQSHAAVSGGTNTREARTMPIRDEMFASVNIFHLAIFV